MKQTLIYILVCVLLCSIALNVFQAVKKPESLDAGTVAPTTDAPTTAPATTAPEEEELTLVELAAITEFINYLRRHFLHNAIHGPVTTLISGYFMTKTSEQQVADLVSDLDGAVLDTKNRVIEVEIVELTDEKIETFLLLFGHEEYFTFRDVIGLPSTGHFPDDYTRPTN